MLTYRIEAHFPRGYIADPYWPEMARLIDIQKASGMNRARSAANRRKALEEYLKGASLTLADYEALEKKAKEPFHHDGDGQIVIPVNSVAAFLVATCHEARAATRPCHPNQVRSRFVFTDWQTGKSAQDGLFERFATVTGGTGQKLSNQRGFRSNPFIGPFDASGEITFDPDFVDPDTLRKAIEWGGLFVGIGASRKMGWGRFDLTEFASRAQRRKAA